MGPAGAGSCESQLRVSHGIPQFAVHAAGASWPQRPENLIVRYEASRRIISHNRSVIYAGFTVYLSHVHAFYSFSMRFLVLFSQKKLQTTMPIVVLKGLWRTGLVSTTWLIRRWLRQDNEKDDGMYVTKRICFKSNAKTIQKYRKNPGPNAKICVAMCINVFCNLLENVLIMLLLF